MTVVGDVERWPDHAEPAGEPAVIAVRGLRMRYGSVEVLKGIGFTAQRGEVITLLTLVVNSGRRCSGWFCGI